MLCDLFTLPNLPKGGTRKVFSQQEREVEEGNILIKEGTNTVKWTVTQYHAKMRELHPRPTVTRSPQDSMLSPRQL